MLATFKGRTKPMRDIEGDARVSFYDPGRETLDRDAIRSLQEERLCRLMIALEDNPFYTAKLADAGKSASEVRTLRDLEQLPFTTKSELVAAQRAHPPFGNLLTYPLSRYRRLHGTSGTSGQPLLWLDSEEDWETWIRCWAISSSDTAPVFMALEAEVTLVGPSGERRIPVGDLYKLDGIDFTTKRCEEILTKIHVPSSHGVRATYLKLRRRGSIDLPILGVAASLSTDGDGLVQKSRIVLTAVESAPVEAKEAERMLVGHKLTDELIREAAVAAYRPAKPLDNTDLTHAYRKKMARVFVARALEELSMSRKT